MLCDVFHLPKKKEAQKLNELKQTSKKKDQQSYAAENCCVRQEMNSEANILHNEQALLQFGFLLLVRPALMLLKGTKF